MSSHAVVIQENVACSSPPPGGGGGVRLAQVQLQLSPHSLRSSVSRLIASTGQSALAKNTVDHDQAMNYVATWTDGIGEALEVTCLCGWPLGSHRRALPSTTRPKADKFNHTGPVRRVSPANKKKMMNVKNFWDRARVWRKNSKPIGKAVCQKPSRFRRGELKST